MSKDDATLRRLLSAPPPTPPAPQPGAPIVYYIMAPGAAAPSAPARPSGPAWLPWLLTLLGVVGAALAGYWLVTQLQIAPARRIGPAGGEKCWCDTDPHAEPRFEPQPQPW